ETPFYCSPTALQRLFHHQGEKAVGAAASKFGTMFGCSVQVQSTRARIPRLPGRILGIFGIFG
ncbi:MAG: alpha-hydroxy-acid oxidizing protein, partial [Cyanobacteria bacterium P01_D01_bin.128]